MLFSFRQVFLACVFVRGSACSECTPQERGCALTACVLAYKNHDIKKLPATPQKACAAWALCVGSSLSRACGSGWISSLQRMIFIYRSFTHFSFIFFIGVRESAISMDDIFVSPISMFRFHFVYTSLLWTDIYVPQSFALHLNHAPALISL